MAIDFTKPQFWLAEIDMHGNPKLIDGAHSTRGGAEKAKALFDGLGLSGAREFAVAEIRLSEFTGEHEPVDQSAIDAINNCGGG